MPHSVRTKKLLTVIGTLILLTYRNDARDVLMNISRGAGDRARSSGGKTVSNSDISVRSDIAGDVVTPTVCFNGSDPSKNQSNHMLNYSYSVLYDYLNGTGAHNFSESVTIGFLGAYRQAQVVLGALPLAVEAVNEDKGMSSRLSNFFTVF